ncbi:universal stress protein [Mycobacterium sp. 1245805.9]|uniref:universal stress protein n=1 Tax=Mycobacterium sp. 1245805.9 TaxID=1856862 RepID=UPI000AABDA42|nr:universal stress protein [Mycobacterium sp. 1245805.9]
MNELAMPQSIVVGIDGSKAAIRAALWAVDEAVHRDAPLRLVCATGQDDPHESEPAAGHAAIRQAVKAIEAAGRPVKIETEVVRGPAIGCLIGASAAAAMVCVGAVGLRHFQPGRVGSTAAALAMSARCPVGIIRARHYHPYHPDHPDGIVVELDGSPDNGVLLGAAAAEARLRNAAIRAIICHRMAPDDKGPDGPEGDRRALADLDRRLARWTRQYPELRVESVAVHGGLLEYLAYNRGSVGLVIAGARDRRQLGSSSDRPAARYCRTPTVRC